MIEVKYSPTFDKLYKNSEHAHAESARLDREVREGKHRGLKMVRVEEMPVGSGFCFDELGEFVWNQPVEVMPQLPTFEEQYGGDWKLAARDVLETLLLDPAVGVEILHHVDRSGPLIGEGWVEISCYKVLCNLTSEFGVHLSLFRWADKPSTKNKENT